MRAVAARDGNGAPRELPLGRQATIPTVPEIVMASFIISFSVSLRDATSNVSR